MKLLRLCRNQSKSWLFCHIMQVLPTVGEKTASMAVLCICWNNRFAN